MIECVKESRGGTILEVHVVPNSKREGIEYDEFSKRLRIKVCARALDGKANKWLIEYLTEILGPCELVSGQTSRKKSVFIPGKAPEEVISLLEGLLPE